MDAFLQDVLVYHGNGKHEQNWIRLRDLFSRNCQLLEIAALEKDPQSGVTHLLLYASHISSTLRASLIVTLLLVYQMEHLTEESYEMFISEVRNFFDYITSQEAECASEELAVLAHKVTQLACDSQNPARVIPSLSRLSNTISPSPDCLTAIHADILQACISGKMYSFAHDFISDCNILEVNPKKCYLEASDFLRYFYYSGIVYISVKDFGKSLECFCEVLAFPADVLSTICVDAFKKAILVSLIQNGKSFGEYFPSHASSSVKKLNRQDDAVDFALNLTPYRLLEKLFLSDELAEVFLNDESIVVPLAQDCNYGLAKQVVNALYSHRIQRISKAYMSLSLVRLNSLIGGSYTVQSLEKKLLQLNNEGAIIAKIDNVTGVVRFQELTSKYVDSMELMESMISRLKYANELSDKLRNMHFDVLQSKKYLKTSMIGVMAKDQSGIASIPVSEQEILMDEGF